MNNEDEELINNHDSVEKHQSTEHTHTAHSHDITDISSKKIFFVTLLNLVITVVEIIGGLISGSLALLSDSIHNLSDTLAIMLSYFANRISKKDKNYLKTFGYKRAEILAAFINSSILLGISLVLIFEAIKRFSNPESINGSLMIIVGFIGLMANFISVYLLEKDSHENLNIKSSYLHLLGDTASSVGVVLGGIAIYYFGIFWIDPVITLLISLYIIKETWDVIKKATDILMQGSPHLDYVTLKHEVESFDNIVNIHHIHAWKLNDKETFFEAHIIMNNITLEEVSQIIANVEKLLKTKYGISHVTLQSEIETDCDTSAFDLGQKKMVRRKSC